MAAVFGVFYGLLNFIQNAVIQEFAPPELRRRIFLRPAFDVRNRFSARTPLSATMFLSWEWNWRMAFACTAIFPVILSFITYRLAPNHARPLRNFAADVEEALLPRVERFGLRDFRWRFTCSVNWE